MNMTFAQAKACQAALEADVERASKAWRAVPGVGTGAIGLTPDAVKFSPAYVAAARTYRTAHAALRAFNSDYVRRFRCELRAERRNARP